MNLHIKRIRHIFIDGSFMLRGVSPASIPDEVFYAYREMADDTCCGAIAVNTDKIIKL